MHNWDRTAPIEETMRAMDDLVSAGKVRYLGFSDAPAWKVAQAQVIAQFRGWTPLIAMQVEYSLLQRTVEGELTPMAQELGIGVMPWSPLKNGWLSGKYSRDNVGTVTSDRGSLVGLPGEKDFQVIDALTAVAEEANASPAAVALAWVQSRPGVSSTIIGARRIDQLRANLAALELKLTEAQIAALDEASKPVLNFPADINRDLSPSFAFAGATVDGQRTGVLPLLPENMVRY
jgi:aryl-alcohol dehydrogenase-like predicted oxidoreductase